LPSAILPTAPYARLVVEAQRRRLRSQAADDPAHGGRAGASCVSCAESALLLDRVLQLRDRVRDLLRRVLASLGG
jgi:hypothetical protein